MILYIDTIQPAHIFLEIKKDGKTLIKKKIKVFRDQAEKLLPALDKILKEKGIALESIKEIVVHNEGGTFTSLRIGIIVANALAFALKIPVKGSKGASLKAKDFQVVKPFYSGKPNIT